MRRSNRLILLVGIFLAIVAFVLILLTIGNGGGGGGGTSAQATTVKVVVAAKDIPLSSKITADEVTTKDFAVVDKPANGYVDTSLVVGQIARQAVSAGQLITTDVLGAGGNVTNITVPPGFVGIALQVGQETGVGTLIKPGDYVDIVTSVTADKLVTAETPSAVPGQTAKPPVYDLYPVLNYNPATVKTLVQGLQVVGTKLPSPAASPGAAAEAGPIPAGAELVIVAATTQQAEIIKFAQLQGNISLVLRATADCQNPDGTASPCPKASTTGITLRVLVDSYGLLPPTVVQVVQPTPLPSPSPKP